MSATLRQAITVVIPHTVYTTVLQRTPPVTMSLATTVTVTATVLHTETLTVSTRVATRIVTTRSLSTKQG